MLFLQALHYLDSFEEKKYYQFILNIAFIINTFVLMLQNMYIGVIHTQNEFGIASSRCNIAVTPASSSDGRLHQCCHFSSFSVTFSDVLISDSD